MNSWLLAVSGWLAVAALMVALWIAQRRTGNAGIVDIAWSAGVGLLAVWFAWGADGLASRRILVATLAALWSGRLATYLVHRLFSGAKNGRYRKLRERWGDRTQRYFFGFFQIQAFWAVMFALPMWLACRKGGALGWMDALGVLI